MMRPSTDMATAEAGPSLGSPFGPCDTRCVDTSSRLTNVSGPASSSGKPDGVGVAAGNVGGGDDSPQVPPVGPLRARTAPPLPARRFVHVPLHSGKPQAIVKSRRRSTPRPRRPRTRRPSVRPVMPPGVLSQHMGMYHVCASVGESMTPRHARRYAPPAHLVRRATEATGRRRSRPSRQRRQALPALPEQTAAAGCPPRHGSSATALDARRPPRATPGTPCSASAVCAGDGAGVTAGVRFNRLDLRLRFGVFDPPGAPAG